MAVIANAWLRAETWAAHDRKHLMEWTIPVFEALVRATPRSSSTGTSRSSDMPSRTSAFPDYAAAEKHLSTAIEVRGPAREAGFEIYEFNRAYCRIKLDKNFERDQPPVEDMRKAVIADLAEARRAFKDLHGDPDVMRWLAINGLKLDDLKPAQSRTARQVEINGTSAGDSRARPLRHSWAAASRLDSTGQPTNRAVVNHVSYG